MTPEILTTVIGSYPVPINPLPLMNQYFNQEKLSWRPYITTAVTDMLNAGIDIITDGQTRDPFIQLFTRKLKGCRVRNRTEVIDTIEYQTPITVEDQIFVKSLLSKQKQAKGVLTGPYTLASSCVDSFYHNEQRLAFAFATALKQEAQALQHHVDMISIDEPSFSNNLPEYGRELIQMITNNLSCPTVLHVCGDISKSIAEIIEMPVDVLSHEFKASPQLLDTFQEYSFPQSLCIGSVRSDDDRVETVEEITTHIKNAQNHFGEKIVHISPDCGQRLLPQQIALQKLKNLVLAGEKIHG